MSDVPDVFDPRGYAGGIPHDSFGWLREHRPVCWQAEPPIGDWPAGPGFWAVTRHTDVVRVLRSAGEFSSWLGATQIRDPDPADLPFIRRMMLNLDPPGHGRLRRIVSRAFTPGRVERFTADVADRARRLVDAVAGRGRCDLATDVTDDFPLLNLADLLGVPSSDRRLLLEWTNRIIGYRFAGQCSGLQAGGEGPCGRAARPERGGSLCPCGAKGRTGSPGAPGRTQPGSRRGARGDMKRLRSGRETDGGNPGAVRGEPGTRPGAARSARSAEGIPGLQAGGGCQQDPDHAGAVLGPDGRPANPRSPAMLADMFGYARRLAAYKVEHPGDDVMTALAHAELADGELEMFFFLLSVAGNDTVRSAGPGGILALAGHRDQWRLLLDRPALLDSAVEEVLRWHPPVLSFRRTATADVDLAGQRVAAGDKVVVFHCSANFDHRVFADPMRFDITRTPNPHVSFGDGPHVCVGAHFARLQLRALYRELVWRLPDLQIDGAPDHLVSNFINGIKHLPVRFTRRWPG